MQPPEIVPPYATTASPVDRTRTHALKPAQPRAAASWFQQTSRSRVLLASSTPPDGSGTRGHSCTTPNSASTRLEALRTTLTSSASRQSDANICRRSARQRAQHDARTVASDCGRPGARRSQHVRSPAARKLRVRGSAHQLIFRRQPGSRLSFRICLSKADDGTIRRRRLTRPAIEPAV